MVDRYHCPKYLIKESNLPDIDVFYQLHPHEYSNWNRLDVRPSTQNYTVGLPTEFSTWNILDRVLPMHLYNGTGVIQHQAPVGWWPKNCGNCRSGQR